ncbi:MAG: hypothetical protein ACLGI9_10005 [Thermoanaerobaculia bacterium]
MRKVLTVVALAATLGAAYLQVFERRARQEEARLAAVRLDDALAGSRARLRAEILTELRAELRKPGGADEPGTQPLPDTVLRRLEAGGDAQEAAVIADLDEALESLARQTEESDRALRRDLEELRAATLRESDVSSRITALLLVALACVVGQLLPDLWPRRSGGEPTLP